MAEPPEPDYYALLSVAPTAGAAEIRRAFRVQARRYHPDVSTEPDAARHFRLVHDAYDVLGDPAKRRAYDAARRGAATRSAGPPRRASTRTRTGPAATPPRSSGAAADAPFSAGNATHSSFQGSTVRSSFAGSAARAAAPGTGRDIEQTVTISLEEAARGLTRRVSVERDEPCPMCHGTAAGPRLVPCADCQGTGFAPAASGRLPCPCPRCHGLGEVLSTACPGCGGSGRVRTPHTLEVSIPAGVRDGQRIRLSGQGQPGRPGARPGDLYLTVRVRPHRTLSRQGDDVTSQVRLTPEQARDGAQVTIPTLYGRVSLTVPPGTADGTVFRLHGRGMPRRGGGTGHHFVQAHISAAAEQQGAPDVLRAWTRRAWRRLGPLKRTLVKRARAL